MAERLFVAVRLPAEAASSLEVYVGPRRRATPGLRWVNEENWHLTLAFLGAVPGTRREPLEESLAEAVARRDRFAIRLAGAGCFPHPGAARVLWLAASAPGDALDRLAAAVRTACQRVGVPPDPTGFTGHLTVARASRPIEATRYLRLVDTFPPLDWPVAEVDLVESTLNRGGSRYRTLASFPLSG